MKQSFNQVKSLVDEIAPFLIRAGLPAKACSMPTGAIETIPTQKYIDVFDFLSDLQITEEWEKVRYAWDLIPPSQWEAYDLYQITDNQEIRLLNTACRNLRVVWSSNRPSGFFGKHINVESEETANETSDSEDVS